MSPSLVMGASRIADGEAGMYAVDPRGAKAARSVDCGMPTPVEASPENALDDEVIGGSRRADAHPDVEFPERRYVEIRHEKELLLLLVKRGNVVERTVVGVVLDPAAHPLREVIADFERRSETPTLMHVRPVQGALEGGIDGEIPAADRLVDDRADLPRPGVGRVGGALKADLGGNADAEPTAPG